MYTSMKTQHGMPLDDRIIPYLQMFGLAHLTRLNDRWFRLDEPLETFSHLAHDTDEEIVRRYAMAYTMMLLSTQLFDDKFDTRMHIQWLSYVVRLEDMGGYSWGSAALSWLYRC
ncbi:hypothetical protein Ahy_B06g080735 [Arachis hypogaea]|uniref:Aminotransferase-like plant mobile domain-containing protein n=1 Tax=Arachis hypogaea TaxID=3818 RepID=A0A444YIT8_ARAHY|nr:hypothetical protein Ahy_B06g080735 [Arachis hypogaea]